MSHGKRELIKIKTKTGNRGRSPSASCKKGESSFVAGRGILSCPVPHSSLSKDGLKFEERRTVKLDRLGRPPRPSRENTLLIDFDTHL
jgi:hypothetical protein